MKVLIGCVLMVVLSGCIPIGIAGRTSAIDAPAPPIAVCPGADLRGVSA